MNINIKKQIEMKKSLIFLLTLLVASSAMAQTFEENQKRVNHETAKLEKRLSEVKDRIFYLEVTLNKRTSDTKAPDSKKIEQENQFKTEDLENLKAEKIILYQTIASLKKTALFGADYRTAFDVRSNLPEQMSSREYKRRSRTQVYKMSEGLTDDTNESNKFKGLVINEKRGQGETASFYIKRVDIKNVPPVSLILNPGEEKEWFLPVGTYEVSVVCGAVRTSSVFHVDPRVLNWFNGKEVYWGVKKNLSDW